jgi:hypothetical protein
LYNMFMTITDLYMYCDLLLLQRSINQPGGRV